MRWLPWSTGAGALARHHGWSPSILVQVSKILPLNTKGKSQCPQPMDVEYVGGAVVAAQMARNPGNDLTLLEMNLIVIKFESMMMLQGFVICPQCLDL